MGEVLTYPLTPVPLSLCHIDGSMNKTPKSTLMKELEMSCVLNNPKMVDVVIVDGMLFLLSDLPETIGFVSRFILRKLSSSFSAKRIDIVFDKKVTPSIKDNERDIRAQGLDRHTVYKISGPVQKRPTDFVGALRNNAFKQALIKFLVTSWKDDANANIIQDLQIYATCGNQCFSFKIEGEKLRKVEETSLKCLNEEADYRMLFHAKSRNVPNTVVIRIAETEVLIITLCNLPKLYQGLKVWLEVGLTSNNTLRYINVNEIYQSLGYRLCRVLPGYHAFTGSDFTASFSRKGKVNPLKKLRKNAKSIKVFSELGDKETVGKKQIRDTEKFVCEMYGKNN